VSRFLYLTQYFPPEVGAAQTRLDSITSLLARRGHHVDVVTAMPSYPGSEILEGYGGRWFMREELDGRAVVRTRALPAMGTGRKRLLSYAVFTASSFVGLVRSKRPDILVVESPPLTLAIPAIVWARLRRVPLVFNIADLWPDAAVEVGALREGALLRVLYALERWTYRSARLVSTVTDGVAARLLSEKHLDSNKLVMLPNGVDVELFSPERGDRATADRVGIPRGPFFVYAGTVGLVHGVGPLIDAFLQLANEPGSPSLVILGAGSERDRLERLAKDSEGHKIKFIDPVPPHVLAEILPLAEAAVVTLADLAINASSRPAKMFPAMASGVPVLFAGVGEGADEVVTSGGGVVVSNQPTSIADAVRGLMKDPEGAREMGRAGREHVLQRWTWDRLLDTWLERVDQLVIQDRRL